MWAAIISSLIAAFASIGNGIMSWRAQKKANEFNQEQYEDWKSYNSPANQMQRLGEAGLNPYMVNGVNNTLSSPFSVGQNTGLSEMFQSLSSSLQGTANTALSAEDKKIGWFNAQTKRTEAEIHDRLADLRLRMVKLAEQRNDPMMALLWGQADAQTIGNDILRRSSDDIVAMRHYDALRKLEDLNFVSALHPMQLDWYVPFQRARVNSLIASANLANRQASHLDWQERFAEDRFLKEYTLGLKQFYNAREMGLIGALQADSHFFNRLSLSNNYYDLARDKFAKDLFYDFPAWSFLKPKLSRSTRGGAGQFPSWTDYEYDY